MSVDDACRVIDAARATGVFPCATIEVGSQTGPLWSDARGAEADTPFDLASLTKPIATTTVIMELVRTGALRLDQRIGEFLNEWRGADREAVIVRDLLEHASGLPARLLDTPPVGRREFEHEICTSPLEYRPRSQSIYSDLGFILLGFIAADCGDRPLDEQFDQITARVPPNPFLTFKLPAEVRRRAAPTRPMAFDARRGRVLVGEVHDNYAASLGGVAGHAGLFGTAAAVGAFARAVLRRETMPFSPSLVREFTTRSLVPGSSRALGWDTMLPTSSCGSRMSAEAFGHVGYTGTSLWIDPVRDRYFVLLTSRVFGNGTLDEMRNVRRAFHDALADV